MKLMQKFSKNQTINIEKLFEDIKNLKMNKKNFNKWKKI